jgi:hypothetical protein
MSDLIPMESKEKISDFLKFCDSVVLITIKTAEQYTQADMAFVKIKKAVFIVDDERKKTKESYMLKCREIDAWYNGKKTFLENLRDKIRLSLSEYETEQRQQQQEEQRKLDAIAERERHEKEAAAQRERDKADKLRQEAEALAERDRAAADKLLVQAAAADTRADAKEIKASEIIAPVAQLATPKSSSYLRDNWKMKITNEHVFVKYCAEHDLLFLLNVNESACNNYAKVVSSQTKQPVKFPGAETVNEQSRIGRSFGGL